MCSHSAHCQADVAEIEFHFTGDPPGVFHRNNGARTPQIHSQWRNNEPVETIVIRSDFCLQNLQFFEQAPLPLTSCSQARDPSQNRIQTGKQSMATTSTRTGLLDGMRLNEVTFPIRLLPQGLLLRCVLCVFAAFKVECAHFSKQGFSNATSLIACSAVLFVFQNASVTWHWDGHNGNNGVWLGSTQAGIRLQLKGQDPLWWAGSPYDSGSSPTPPESWNNNGAGGISAFQNGTVIAFTGA